MRAAPGLNGFLKPKQPILGFYLAGEIEAVGQAVTRFKPGDQVYGNTGLSVLGTYAEYVCLPEDGALAPMPAHLTYAEAAAIPNGALTALPFLRDAAKLQRGQSVLIIGASGAVRLVSGPVGQGPGRPGHRGDQHAESGAGEVAGRGRGGGLHHDGLYQDRRTI